MSLTSACSTQRGDIFVAKGIKNNFGVPAERYLLCPIIKISLLWSRTAIWIQFLQRYCSYRSNGSTDFSILSNGFTLLLNSTQIKANHISRKRKEDPTKNHEYFRGYINKPAGFMSLDRNPISIPLSTNKFKRKERTFSESEKKSSKTLPYFEVLINH